MAALSETRLSDVGELAEANYTLFWSGRAPNLKREAGVGFAIKTSLVPKLTGKPKAINDRLMTVQFPLSKKRCATLISVYAPTMQYSDEDKEKFYSELRAAIDAVPSADRLIILGDFNPGGSW